MTDKSEQTQAADDHQCTSLLNLLPILPDHYLVSVIDVAIEIPVKSTRDRTLSALTPRSAAAGYGAEALDVAGYIEELEIRAIALAGAVGQLPDPIRGEALKQVLALLTQVDTGTARRRRHRVAGSTSCLTRT